MRLPALLAALLLGTSALVSPLSAQEYYDSAGTKVFGYVPLGGCAAGKRCTGPAASSGGGGGSTSSTGLTATLTSSTTATLTPANGSLRTALVDIECDTQSTTPGAYLAVFTDASGNVMARVGLPDIGYGSAHEAHFILAPATAVGAANNGVTMTITGNVSVSCTINYFMAS